MYKGGLSHLRKAEDPLRRSLQRHQGLPDTQPTCLPILQHHGVASNCHSDTEARAGSPPSLSSGCCASGKLLLSYSKTSAYNLLTASGDVTSAMPFFAALYHTKDGIIRPLSLLFFPSPPRESQNQLPTTKWNDLLKLSSALTPTDCACSCV